MTFELNIDEIMNLNFIPLNNPCEEIHRDVSTKKIRKILAFYKKASIKRKFSKNI